MITSDRFNQLLSAGLRVSGLGLRFLLLFVLARAMPIESFALFGLYAAALQLGAPLILLDFYAQTTRQVLASGETDKPVNLRRHWGAIFLSVALFSPAVAAAYYWSVPETGLLLLAIFSCHLIIEAFATDISRLLVPLGRPFLANLVLFLRSGVWCVPIIVAVEAADISVDLAQVVLCWLVGSAMATVTGALFAAGTLGLKPVFDWVWVKRAVAASLVFFLSTLVFRSLLGVDKFVIEAILGLQILGVYTLYAGVALGVLSVVEAGISSWRFPKLVAAIQRRDGIEVRARLRRFLGENAVASSILMLALGLTFPWAAHVFLDPVYTQSIQGFYVILAGTWLYCLSLPFHYAIYGFGRDHILLAIYACAMCAMLVWGLLLMPGLGVLGGVMMLAISLGVIAVLRCGFALASLRSLPSQADHAKG